MFAGVLSDGLNQDARPDRHRLHDFAESP
jgi:hypothetical protein